MKKMKNFYDLFIKEDYIIEYVMSKIKSTIDNKFFDYSIKKIEDENLLKNILEKTSKSFIDLEKAFLNFIETGSTSFMITKDLIKHTNKDAKITNSIKCSVNFPIGKTYIEYIKYTQNDIEYISNYIKLTESKIVYINDKDVIFIIDKSLKDIKKSLEDLKEDLKNSEYYLDEVFKDFKEQLINIFFESVSVRSNNLINVDILKDKINVNFISVTKEDVVDSYYDKLYIDRNKFLNDAKVIVSNFIEYDNLSEEEKQLIEERSKDIDKDAETKQKNKEISLKNKYNIKHEKIVDDINNENIPFEYSLNGLDEVYQVDPVEFFNKSNNIFEYLFKSIDDEKE